MSNSLDWLDAIQASIPFALTLPLVVATVFAAFVDRLERYLEAYREVAAQAFSDDAAGTHARQPKDVYKHP